MVKNFFFLLLFCVVFASSAFATTQYYYLRTTGAGSNSGDRGTWAVVPTSDANAMSASNFNDSGNWSATDDANKLDADDVVYIKGNWNSHSYDITPVYGVTLDFQEVGDFDPKNATTAQRNAEPIFSGSTIYVKTDNVKILDGRFGYGGSGGTDFHSPAYIIHANPVALNPQDRIKISGLEVKRCSFYGSYSSDGVAILLGFHTDAIISGNYYESYDTNWPDCTGHSRFLGIHAGSRNKITDNYIKGGYTGPIFWFKKDFNQDGTWDIPPIGDYAIDPDGNFEDNEVANNYIEYRCEEGITNDPGNNSNAITEVERDTVASINGNQITLSHGGWASAGNKYSGMYMVAVAPISATPLEAYDSMFGRNARIEGQSNATFTFSDNVSVLFPGLEVGSYVIVGLVYRHNWIHDNTFSSNHPGFAEDSIHLEGISLENLIENNTMAEVAREPGHGVDIRALHGLPKSTGSITQTSGICVSAFNIVRNNTMYGIIDQVYDKTAQHPSETAWPFVGRNNAYYNNTLYDGVKLVNSRAYVSGSSVLYQTHGTLDSDPTGYVSDYFENWELPLASPPRAPLASPLRAPQELKIIIK